MTAKRTIAAATGAALVVAVGVSALTGGTAAERRGGRPFEYARLYLGEDTWILYESRQTTTIQPPTNELRRDVDQAPTSPVRYTAKVRVTHNFSVGALNFVGSRGWEAVDVTPEGDGRMVLLKRPR